MPVRQFLHDHARTLGLLSAGVLFLISGLSLLVSIGEPNRSAAYERVRFGHIYDGQTGRLISGSEVFLTQLSSGQRIDLDASTGVYEFPTDLLTGGYTLEITPPEGYVISHRCLPHNDSYIARGTSTNTIGASLFVDQLSSFHCDDNPYYMAFTLREDGPAVINNNIQLLPSDLDALENMPYAQMDDYSSRAGNGAYIHRFSPFDEDLTLYQSQDILTEYCPDIELEFFLLISDEGIYNERATTESPSLARRVYTSYDPPRTSQYLVSFETTDTESLHLSDYDDVVIEVLEEGASYQVRIHNHIDNKSAVLGVRERNQNRIISEYILYRDMAERWQEEQLIVGSSLVKRTYTDTTSDSCQQVSNDCQFSCESLNHEFTVIVNGDLKIPLNPTDSRVSRSSLPRINTSRCGKASLYDIDVDGRGITDLRIETRLVEDKLSARVVEVRVPMHVFAYATMMYGGTAYESVLFDHEATADVLGGLYNSTYVNFPAMGICLSDTAE